MFAKDLEYLEKNEYVNIISDHNEISKMLFGLRKSLQSKSK
jgi:hypothetical protein